MPGITIEQIKKLVLEAQENYAQDHLFPREALQLLERLLGAELGPSYSTDQRSATDEAWDAPRSMEKIRGALRERLKAFQYPYPEGNRRGKTFYQHLEQIGALDLLLQPPLISAVRGSWLEEETHRRSREMELQKRSGYGYPLKFHRQALWEIARHVEALQKIAAEHGVPNQRFAAYRALSLEELLREVSVYYPKAPRSYTPAYGISYPWGAILNQVLVFNAIRREFSKKRIFSKNLGYQLTALICSRPDSVSEKQLDPKPTTVRRNIRNYRG